MSPQTTPEQRVGPADTKERILSAAERIFVERGIAATSLRAVTAAAQVNLAAVHYHFGSKRGLLNAVIARRIAPPNQERLKRLDQLESATLPAQVEEVLMAFLEPVLEAADSSQTRGIPALLYSEPEEQIGELIGELFGEVSMRFCAALERALPHLSRAEVLERFKFVIGVMVHVVSGHFDIEPMPGMAPARPKQQRLQAIVAFLSAGLRSPAFVGNPGRTK